MFVPPVCIFLMCLTSMICGAFVWHIANATGRNYEERTRNKTNEIDEGNGYDIGAYSNAWWERNN